MKRNADFPFSDRSCIKQIEIPSEFSPFPPTMPASQIMRMLRLTFLMDLKNHRILSGTCHPIPSLSHKDMTVLASSFRNNNAGTKHLPWQKAPRFCNSKSGCLQSFFPSPQQCPFISSTYEGQHFSITGRNFMASFCACGQSIFADFSNAEE